MNARLFVLLCVCLLLTADAAAQPTCSADYPVTSSCPPLTEIIFVGRVVSLKDERSDQDGRVELSEVDLISGSMRGRAFVVVEMSLRGEVPPELDFRLFRLCYGRLEKGKRYFFHASRTNGTLEVIRWSQELDTKPEEASHLFNLIRSLINGDRLPRLSGIVEHLTRPAPNIVVIAREDDQKFETVTRTNGRYEFWDLPDGQYKVNPLLPPSLRPAEDNDHERKDYGYEVSVRNNEQCGARADFLAWDNGEIRGRVQDADGVPVKYVIVNLLFLNDPKTRQGPPYPARQVIGLELGRFAFVNLVPGSVFARS